jgi:5-(carboxyamino)imidazole ribonucleotide synthase
MKVGILGGGQLGRMLLQAAANYTVETYVLENDENCPAAHLCHHFIKGDIKNFDAVYNFGKKVDALTIEIENVNIEALKKLESEGKKIFPSPSALQIIKNKVAQKKFYSAHQIPTSEFFITENSRELFQHKTFLPAVHKLGEGGYDGRGVQIISSEKEIEKGFNAPSVLEKLINIKKEISVIVAMKETGEIAIFPPAEMIFNAELNLLDYQISPAQITDELKQQCEKVARQVVIALQSAGIFAVELFIDENNNILVNETAPRVHNSGHHTIEANYSSQYDMLWRIILQYPLGNAAAIMPAVIVNLIGAENYNGKVVYEGLNEVLKMPDTFVHLYGKEITKPGRKMGHVTIMSNDYNELKQKAHAVKQLIKV